MLAFSKIKNIKKKRKSEDAIKGFKGVHISRKVRMHLFGSSPFFDSDKRFVSLRGSGQTIFKVVQCLGPPSAPFFFFSLRVLNFQGFFFVRGLVIVSSVLPQISVAVISSKWMSLLPLRTS